MTKTASFIYWVWIVFVSLLLFWGSVYLLNRVASVHPTSTSLAEKNYYRSYTKDQAIPALTYSLENGIPVVFGSSELADDLPYQPYKYLPEKFGIPVTAFGDIGFQQMTIVTALKMAANNQSYKNGRVVIILSPQWFIDGEGVHPEVMNKKLFSPENLARLCSKSGPDTDKKQGILDYVSSKSELRIPAITLSVCEKYPATRVLIGAVDKIAHASRQLQSLVITDLEHDQKFAGLQSLNVDAHWAAWTGWPEEEERARIVGANACHNAFDTDDKYFEKFLKQELKRGGLPKSIAMPPAMLENHEYLHFLELLKELRGFSHKPIFVLLPLNPKIYKNAQILDPIMAKVSSDLRAYEFGVLDLWSIPYKSGRLNGPGHPGPLGWVEIGEAVIKHFEF